ncbi:MAG: chromate transporter [Candidatus Baltobacteraceae bacterium]
MAFATLALRGFGGVGGQAQHFLTREKGWLSDSEFGEMIAICQALPGPNVGNVAVLVGDRFGGVLGAVCAMAGFCVPSTAVAIGLALLLARVADLPHVAALEAGIVAGAAGLIVASGVRIALHYRTFPLVLLAIAALIAAILFARLPLALVVILAVPTVVLVQRVRTTAV